MPADDPFGSTRFPGYDGLAGRIPLITYPPQCGCPAERICSPVLPGDHAGNHCLPNKTSPTGFPAGLFRGLMRHAKTQTYCRDASRCFQFVSHVARFFPQKQAHYRMQELNLLSLGYGPNELPSLSPGAGNLFAILSAVNIKLTDDFRK